MIDLYWLKLRHVFLLILTRIMFYIIALTIHQTKSKSVLFIRLDSIGDYILLRNFFTCIKDDARYKNKTITLCGNIIWKNLAEYFDKNVFDDFIWLDRNKFDKNIAYRFSFLKEIYRRGFEVAIESTYSREILFGDTIVAISKAKERIGCTGSINIAAKLKRNFLSDSFYTKLFVSNDENVFEFYRNKEFFEKLLKKELSIEGTNLDCSNIKIDIPTAKDYILIFPGAQYKDRIWQPENYVKLIENIFLTTEYDVILAGSNSEKKLSETIKNLINNPRLIDMTGKTSIVEVVKLVADATMLAANESTGVHIAAAVKVPFVCISNGQHLGRFNPYPKEIFEDGYYIYPEEISKRLDAFDKLVNEYRFEAIHDINSIKPDRVIDLVNSVLKKIEEKNT